MVVLACFFLHQNAFAQTKLILKIFRQASAIEEIQLFENTKLLKKVAEFSTKSTDDLTATLDKCSKLGAVNVIEFNQVTMRLGSDGAFYARVTSSEERAMLEELAGRLPRTRIEGDIFGSVSSGTLTIYTSIGFVPVSKRMGSFVFVRRVGLSLKVPLGVSKVEVEKSLVRFLSHPQSDQMVYVFNGKVIPLKSSYKAPNSNATDYRSLISTP